MNKSIEVKSGQMPEIIMALRLLYANITIGYPARATLTLTVPPAMYVLLLLVRS